MSIDPGVDGYALGWVKDDPSPVGYCAALHPESLWALFTRVQARVAVVEGQYIGNPQIAGSVLDLGFRMGISIGWVAAVMHGSLETQQERTLHLFTAPPSSWQAHQRRVAGIMGRLDRATGLRLTVARGEKMFGFQDEWKRATKKQREGMASALGIGEWWRSLWLK